MNWQERLYQGYVTTGQASTPMVPADLRNPLHLQIIQRYVPKSKGIKVLDLACGNGRLVHNLKACGYENVLGVDFSQQQVDVAHQWGISEVRCQDVLAFLRSEPSASWDVVFAMDFLEHLAKQDLMDLVDDVRRVLVPGGIFVVQVPNGGGLFGGAVLHGDMTHVQAFTDMSLRQLMNCCGFSSIQCHEVKPVVHGVKSLARHVLWEFMALPLRLLSLAETGMRGQIFSQNILAITVK
jgi:2-polyprenyl-3-methyl-5-hydroxy-6-metoxy-1,4-benzoquinol methylase